MVVPFKGRVKVDRAGMKENSLVGSVGMGRPRWRVRVGCVCVGVGVWGGGGGRGGGRVDNLVPLPADHMFKNTLKVSRFCFQMK